MKRLPFLVLSLLAIEHALFACISQEMILQNNRFEQLQNTKELKSRKGYRNIIFDVGNVLLEWNPLKLAASIRAQFNGAIIDDDCILQLTSSEGWEKWDIEAISRAELKEFGTIKLKQLDQKAFTAFLDCMPYSLIPIESGVEILREVKARGYHVYVLSNMPREDLVIIKQQIDFFKLFDGEIFSCNEHYRKPDLMLYQILLQRYNLDPSDCLFIDDVQKNIDAAKAVGIDGIVCTSHAFVKDELKRLGILD